MRQVGTVRHFFDKVSVAIVDVLMPIKVGDELEIRGTTTNLSQKLDSMQVEHKSVSAAKKGDAVGLKVNEKVRKGDVVYKK